MTDTHWIERTSPKGMPFVGTCPKCGKKGLTVADANKPCENIIGLTKDQSLVGAITGRIPTND